MNIVLVGFRCTGKTTVGKCLADRLRREFVDSDQFIERKSGMTIRELFVSKGESSFRQIESEALNELAKLDGKIIAAGGGAVLWYKNIHNLKRNGHLILLEAGVDVIQERLQSDPVSVTQRPRLTTHTDLRREIEEQFELRRPYYQKAADHIVDTHLLSVEQVVAKILEHLEAREILGRFV